jgi:hypothetical protein
MAQKFDLQAERVEQVALLAEKQAKEAGDEANQMVEDG